MDRNTAFNKVMSIIDDISDRKGIGDEMQMIDEAIKYEMIEEWIAILMKE